jgi:N-acetylmuramoyl-L-alanine amidase
MSQQNDQGQGRPSGGRLSSLLSKLPAALRAGRGLGLGRGAALGARLLKVKALIASAPVLAVVLGVILLTLLIMIASILGGMAANMSAAANCDEPAAAQTLPPGSGVVVGASEYGGPRDPTTHGDSGSFGHLNGHMAFAELGLSGRGDGNPNDAHMIGDALGTNRALPAHAKLRITANGHSVIAEKLDTGGGGGPVGSPPHPRAIDLWYQTAEALNFNGTGLVTIELLDPRTPTTPLSGASAAAPTASVSATTAASAADSAPAPAAPHIVNNMIPFGQRRKEEMRRYAIRHYGIDSYELTDPKVIVEHFTEGTSWQSAYNTFAPDIPDSELHELPGVTSHFIIDQNGVIHQVLPLNLMGRHTVGLNYTAIGIEMVGMSDREILDRPPELNAALALTRWLQSQYHIATRNVIGHNESLSSPYHHEDVARLANQTHGDWQKADMDTFRAKLSYEPPSAAVQAGTGAGSCSEPDTSGSALGPSIVQIAESQLGTKETGENCNPYGPLCERWCSDFLTWVWQRAGINIPRLPYSGDVYRWGEAHSQVLAPSATPQPGDAVEFGGGPGASEHVGIVEKVFANGEITMISGNWGNKVGRSQAFQPSQAAGSGMPGAIYGYVVP